MQFLPVAVKNFENDVVSLELERLLAVCSRTILCDLSTPRPRVVRKMST